MNSGCRRFGLLSHRTDGSHQSLLELVQGDGFQIRSLAQERFDDGLNNDGGIGTAGSGLHRGFQGGIYENRVGQIRDAYRPWARKVPQKSADSSSLHGCHHSGVRLQRGVAVGHRHRGGRGCGRVTPRRDEPARGTKSRPGVDRGSEFLSQTLPASSFGYLYLTLRPPAIDFQIPSLR